jgi:hypothetical protein
MATYNYRTIQKLVADLCKNVVPIVAHSERERDDLFDKIKTFVETDKRITTAYSKYRGSEDPDWVKGLKILFSDFDKNYSPIPSLRFDKLGRLCMDNYYADTHRPVDFSTLQRIIDDVHNLLEIDEADKLKKQKMRDLKTQGILARLTEIAQEDGFKFSYEQMPTRVKLMVKLPENKLLNVDIPFSNFQEVMQKVRPFIKNSREIAETGIAFTIEKLKRR